MIVGKQGQEFVRWLRGWLVDGRRSLVEKVLQQQRDVFLVLAQRRHLDLVHRQAEIEIRTKVILAHHLRQFAVGRTDDACVTGAGHIRSQREVHVLLQQTQQFDLRSHRQIADLVEEQRATGSLGDQPGT
ncbi:MAG: hypothetical protein AW09_003726 [Candidatus Accumulibacter phosphatis]|uniref:Uncharacterized protein n=1 Tax=Candidatus Accumulibacter phosphatis TaxID=327160 RepID=A0A080LU49_9PROT|nr:MAG: hypothetical protein AW09_003726 [Candidatus Accumulibacter phosphatis]